MGFYREAATRVAAPDHHEWIVTATIVAAASIVVIGMFGSTAASMVATWYRSDTFAHGYLILPLTIYLIWTDRHRILPLTPVPNFWGLPVIAIFGFAWFIGNISDVLLVQHLALVSVVQILVWTLLGSQIVRALLFPLAFLFFAVPMGESLIGPLQDLTAFLAVKALQFSRLPVLWEGTFITTPSQAWEIAAACSGIRYVIPAAVLTSLYSYISYRRWSRRLGFVFSGLLLMVLANGLRVYAIMMLTHWGEHNEMAGHLGRTIHTMWGHLVYGWIMFGVMMFALFWLGSIWREQIGAELTTGLRAVGMKHSGPLRLSLIATSAVALLALAPMAADIFANRLTVPVPVKTAMPSVDPPWMASPDYGDKWFPRFAGASAEMTQSYAAGDHRVRLYIAYYAIQRQGAELINEDNVLLDGVEWVRLAERQTRAVIDHREIDVHETLVRSSKGHHRRLVWNWYWVDGQFTSNPYYAKLLQAKARLLGRSQEAAVIAVAADTGDRGINAAQILQDFVDHMSVAANLNRFARS